MQDNKNLIFAVVLSTIILFSWQYFYAGPRIIEAQKYAKQQQKLAPEPRQELIPSEVENEQNPELPSLLQDRKEVIRTIERIKINTDKIHGSISLKGARFDDLTLVEHKTENSKDADEVVLLSPSGSKRVYFAEFGWLSANHTTIVPNSQTIWYTDNKQLTQDSPVILSWDNNFGLKFFVKIEIDENYMFKITRSVENYGNTAEAIQPYGILNRTRPADKHSVYISHEGAIGVLDGILKETTYNNLKDDKKFEYKNSKGWIGIADKYWLTTLIPDQDNSFDTNFTYFYLNGQDRYQVDYLGQKFDIAPGKSVEISSHLFAGPKKVNMLDDYGQQLGLQLFDRAVDFGYLYFITKPIFKVLNFFYHLFGNFGLAILMLTVLLKALLFPLANKSYVSMHHLKRLQPQILDLKDRYKNDKMALNKAVMELYKEEKVNPMAGCLPLLVQIPIFFALYKVLYVTIEMRHAPFYGWITDLSAPDPTTVFNLFGLLPFTPPQHFGPVSLMIGAWPLIMGITMFLQQRMNPEPADPVQAKIIKTLPFMFVFLFATFPAGLVMYWAWNNTLSILQQWIITRRLPKA